MSRNDWKLGPGVQVAGVRGQLRRLWDVSPSLVVLALANAALVVPLLVGLLVDPRMVTGQLVWVKPLKFAASIVVYALTLLWMLSHVEGRRRMVRAVGAVTLVTVGMEIVLITLQAARGVRSHFNVATPFDAAVFQVMAGAIGLAWAAGLVAAWLLLRQRMADRALAWSLRLGLVFSLVGAGLGGLMTSPSAAQVEQLRQGQPGEAGGHSVGVADGGAGLPVVGWSTEGGDLRVPHFLGLHAMQVLPLLGLWLARGRLGRRLREGQRVGLVWTASLAYGGGIAVMTAQALRGEPLLSPGPTTLASLGALAAATLLAAGATARLGGRCTTAHASPQGAHP